MGEWSIGGKHMSNGGKVGSNGGNAERIGGKRPNPHNIFKKHMQSPLRFETISVPGKPWKEISYERTLFLGGAWIDWHQSAR